MIRKVYFIFFLLIFISCGPTNKIPKPETSKELSIKNLNEKNLVPIHYPYKKNYTRIISYLYENHRKDFIKIKGDFRNIKFGNNSAYNFMVGYWENYGAYKTSLVVMIRTSDNSTQSIKMKHVMVSSSKFGDLLEMPTKNIKTFQDFPPILFIRKIDVPSKYDIIEMVKDDIITITIEGAKYFFINPEIQ